jgi:hypothetical protein
MAKSLLLIALCLFVVAIAQQSNPITRVQFTAAYQQTVTISTGSSSSGLTGVTSLGKRDIGDVVTTTNGQMYPFSSFQFVLFLQFKFVFCFLIQFVFFTNQFVLFFFK